MVDVQDILSVAEDLKRWACELPNYAPAIKIEIFPSLAIFIDDMVVWDAMDYTDGEVYEPPTFEFCIDAWTEHVDDMVRTITLPEDQDEIDFDPENN